MGSRGMLSISLHLFLFAMNLLSRIGFEKFGNKPLSINPFTAQPYFPNVSGLARSLRNSHCLLLASAHFTTAYKILLCCVDKSAGLEKCLWP